MKNILLILTIGFIIGAFCGYTYNDNITDAKKDATEKIERNKNIINEKMKDKISEVDTLIKKIKK